MKWAILNQKQRTRQFLIIFLVIISLAVTFFLSFQYFFLADFPIGHDVIAHIYIAKIVEAGNLFSSFKVSLYPFSTLVFIFWHKILSLFNFSWERTFIFYECFNLFLVSVFSGILSYKIFKKKELALLTMIFLSSSRWLNDSLRIGLMAETFGWVIFVISLIFLFDKKWLYFALSFLFLFFAHPLPFGFLTIIFFCFFFFWIVKNIDGKEKIKLFAILAIICIAGVLFYYIFPEIFHKIAMALREKFAIEGERSPINYMIDMGRKRVLLYTFSFFGFLFLCLEILKRRVGKMNQEKCLLFLIFVLISLVFCFKHYLGVHYLGYRFYVYLEIASAILAAFALYNIALMLSKELLLFICIPFVFMLVYPNFLAIRSITSWQLNTPELNDATPIEDQKALKEIRQLLKPNAKIYSHSIWHTWLKIDGFVAIGDWYAPHYAKLYKNKNLEKLYQYLIKRKIDYIYFSSIDSISEVEKVDFLFKIYDKYGVRVYEVKKSKN